MTTFLEFAYHNTGPTKGIEVRDRSEGLCLGLILVDFYRFLMFFGNKPIKLIENTANYMEIKPE